MALYRSYLDDSVGTGASTINDMRDQAAVDIGLGISSDFYVSGISTFVGLSTFNDGMIMTGVSTFYSDVGVVGVITANSGEISGNFNVGGVLTYEDVTNIDSVGMVTARSGFRATAGGLHVQAGVSTFQGYTENVTALGTITGSNNLDVGAGSVFTCTIAGTNAVTFTVTNPVSGQMCSGIVIVTWTGTGTRSITMTNGKWQGGSPPVWSATATTDIFSFFTPDNGTNVYVSTLGVGYA